jgi:hypothetical protein
MKPAPQCRERPLGTAGAGVPESTRRGLVCVGNARIDPGVYESEHSPLLPLDYLTNSTVCVRES